MCDHDTRKSFTLFCGPWCVRGTTTSQGCKILDAMGHECYVKSTEVIPKYLCRGGVPLPVPARTFGAQTPLPWSVVARNTSSFSHRSHGLAVVPRDMLPSEKRCHAI
ncbi:protein of unknown function [Methanoculleus bourgensis]|uniref:Uncharacterized protein n=1 Tax=Methanoculleus bourgensis TaxID=83986 RepID=A0A0X3BPU0_9EURY|nr:protein of unknown function [Methanoculleus bourgensis]